MPTLFYNQMTGEPNGHSPGLTKLEAFTLAAMQGLCARDIPLSSVRIDQDHLAEEATRIAQATIEALNSINTEPA